MIFNKTKTILSSLFLLFVFNNISNAQEIHELSVKEAVDLAFKNVTDLKNERLDYKIADARNKEIVGLALPQINGAFQGNHYLSLPQIQFPDGSDKAIYDILRENGVRDGMGNPITKDVDISFRNFSFQTPWNVNAGLSVQQLLFEPQFFVGL
jgi:hypothetical protein